MRVAALLACVMLCPGCIAKVLTPALVHRFEDGAFRHCQLTLGWTIDELEAACGKPLKVFPSANDKAERCLVYPSLAVGLAVSTSRAAPYFAVCVRPTEWIERRGTDTKFTEKDRVSGVYGLKDLPAP